MANHSAPERRPDSPTPWRVHLPPASLEPVTERDAHVLLWIVRGVAEVAVAEETYRLSAGHAVWVPVGLRHSFVTEENSVVVPALFDVATTATTLGEPSVIVVDRDLRTLLLAHVQASFAFIKAKNVERQILSLLEDNPVVVTTLPMPATEAALIVAEALRFNPGDDRSVHELARSAHASVSKVERAFLAETGMTLRQWRIKNRMETAGMLLRAPTAVDAVAQRVGYTNTSAFGRVFKGHFGMTPGEYIARYRRQR
ncbi:MAG TPA: helix-turn-helix domain-containing protein [Arachnia sp.]|nr:helix-turn-helix domain-containing protein [Arachnia sp.]HMT85572.1 helix-turn-helix domain-containing protein [Arachnia sp.]